MGRYVRTKNGKAVTPENPLAIQIAEALKLIGVDIQGIKLINSGESMPVTIVGGSAGGGASGPAVEITEIAANIQLRDTAEKTVPLPSLLNYTKYGILVYNGTDADLKVAPWNANVATLDDGSYGFFGTGTTEDSFAWLVPKKIAANNGNFYLHEMEPKQNGATSTKKVKNPDKLFEDRFNAAASTVYTLAYKAMTTPTTNGVTIKLIGWLK
ncbi:MAG: hypothetical protein ABS894_00970 [Aerococcus urinaeequi]